MTDAQKEKLTARVLRKLGIDSPDAAASALIEDELDDAESEILMYLGMDTLLDAMISYVAKLAVIYYQRDIQAIDDGGMVKSSAYSEAERSQTDTYLTPEDTAAAAKAVMDSLARYRVISVKEAVIPNATA